MKTVVHVIEAFSGGAVDTILYLTKGLKQFRHVIVYSIRNEVIDDGKIFKRFDGEVEFIYWQSAQREISLKKDWQAAVELKNILDNIDFDVLHLHSSKAGFLGRLVGVLFRSKKIIYTTHGVSFNRQDISSISKYKYVLLEKIAQMLSGEVICCSPSERDTFKNKNIKAKYICNGVEVSRNGLLVYPQRFTVITTGRVAQQKDPVYFNKIAQFFEGKYPIKFVWIGDGDMRHLLTSKNIEITGWLEKSKVEEVVKKSSLYISTSLWEGLPYAVLEAMQMGRPLLLRNCVGNVDLVEEGRNGFLFDTPQGAIQKIQYLLEHHELIAKLGSNSNQLCGEKFDLKDFLANYEKQYAH